MRGKKRRVTERVPPSLEGKAGRDCRGAAASPPLRDLVWWPLQPRTRRTVREGLLEGPDGSTQRPEGWSQWASDARESGENKATTLAGPLSREAEH